MHTCACAHLRLSHAQCMSMVTGCAYHAHTCTSSRSVNNSRGPCPCGWTFSASRSRTRDIKRWPSIRCTRNNIGLDIKVLDKQNMPRTGDVMVYKKDATLGQTKDCNALFSSLLSPTISNEATLLLVSPAAVAMPLISSLKWKMDKETSGKK